MNKIFLSSGFFWLWKEFRVSIKWQRHSQVLYFSSILKNTNISEAKPSLTVWGLQVRYITRIFCFTRIQLVRKLFIITHRQSFHSNIPFCISWKIITSDLSIFLQLLIWILTLQRGTPYNTGMHVNGCTANYNQNQVFYIKARKKLWPYHDACELKGITASHN